MEPSEHNWANISKTICPGMLILASRPFGCRARGLSRRAVRALNEPEVEAF